MEDPTAESAQDSMDDCDGTYPQSETLLIAHETFFSYGLLVGTRSTDGLSSVPMKYPSRCFEGDDNDTSDLVMPDEPSRGQSSTDDDNVAVPQNQSYKSDMLDIPFTFQD